jgi:hypothetical protein
MLKQPSRTTGNTKSTRKLTKPENKRKNSVSTNRYPYSIGITQKQEKNTHTLFKKSERK